MDYHSNPVVLTIKDVDIHIGISHILEQGNLVVHQGERLGLIGSNGSGKSTILKTVLGEVEIDGGEIIIPSNIVVGYLPQDVELDEDKSIYENIKSGAQYIIDWISTIETLDPGSPKRSKLEDKVTMHDGWNIDEKVFQLIENLNIPSNTTELMNLSGGEKRRIALAKALVANPDLLILDEPTNHLDLVSIAWLEDFLKDYHGTCVLVTHDRYFLDRVASRIVELDRRKFHSHKGNYSEFLLSKAKREEVEIIKEEKKQKFLKKEILWVKSGVKARGTKDKGRVERFYDLADEEKYVAIPEASILMPPPPPFSKRIVDFKNVSYQIDKRELLNDFEFSFDKNDRVGIVGPNGAGKTTFLKLLQKELETTKGKVIVGEKTEFNYFDQAKVTLNESNTVFQEIGNGSDTIKFGGKSMSLRGYLKRFLFTDDKIKTEISLLSGGEKSRLLLAKILMDGGNFIILDEPTNDLDLDTLRILEETLINFDGCVIIVSHDRYFLNRVCNKIFYMKGDGSVERYEGNYDDFAVSYELKQVKERQNIPKKIIEPLSEDEVILTELTKEERDELRKMERRISNAEKKVMRIEEDFANPDIYNNPVKVKDLTIQLENSKKRVADLYSRWEELESRS